MSGILVSVKPMTSAGRLYPRYDEESGILVAQSRVERAWPFGVDVDGTLIFDLDERRILSSFDLHIPKSRWKRDLGEDVSMIARGGDLEFTEDAVKRKSFHLPLRVTSSRDASHVRIELGNAEPDQAIALSDSCIALLAGGELAGFFLRGIR